MLPNSRIIPPNTTTANHVYSNNKKARSRSNSAINDSTVKKGFISRLLTNPKDQPPPPSPPPQRPKDDYAAWGTPRSSSEHSKSSTTSSSKGSSGFGKLFKKRTKTLEDDIALLMNEDDQPKVRPIHHTNSRKHAKIPLAPPPNYPRSRSISQPDQQQFLTNLPDHYIDKRPPTTIYTPMPIVIPPTPPPPVTTTQSEPEPLPSSISRPSSRANTSSSTSLRKSSGSYSIYSTFGGESVYSIEATSAKVSSSPSSPSPPPHNNREWQRSNHSVAGESECSFSTVISNNAYSSDNDDHTVTDNETSDDDDDFVDASGFSQEDIEQERRMDAKNLTKRLSGGHFGSAGGLVLSIHGTENETATPPSPPPPVPTTPTKRKSQKIPADDELAKSMLNWKRHSDSNKRWSMRSHSALVEAEAAEAAADKHASTITVIDLRSALPQLPQDSTKVEVAVDTKADEEEELSVPDKLALRKEAEEALSRPTIHTVPQSSSSVSPSPTSPLLTSLSSDIDKSISLTSEFSKTLDDVWKTSDDTLQLFDDPRTKQLQTSIQIRIADHDEEEEETTEDDKIKEAATSLWNEDETVVVRERMAEWLGQGKPFQTAVLYEYMQFFVFTDMRLDSAFRKLCSKLYFKAEAQQIDRILESFANRYWDCNPDSLFGSADIVYAVVYSLLLLNTDLHVAQGNHARMTRSEFIRNTMSTVRDQRDHEELMGHKHRSTDRNWEAEIEYYLKEMYISVKNYQILQPLTRKTSLSKRGSILGSRRVIGLKRSVNSIIRKSGRESMMAAEAFDQTLSSPPPPPPRSSMSSGYNRPMTPSSSIKSPRRESFSSASSSAASFSSRCGSPTMMPQQQQHASHQPMIQYMNTHAASLFSSRPPYYKEGVVMRKHLLENATHKARHREWRECYLEVGQDGELRMYALQGNGNQLSDKSMFRHSSAAHFNLSDALLSNSTSSTSINKSTNTTLKPSGSASFSGVSPNNKHWAAHSQLIGKIELNHTLSNPLPPPGYNRQRPHVFAIQQSDGGVYLFQTASIEQTQEWVSTCNYWAARESKEPLPGGVSNMEYGWGSCLDDVIMDLDAARQGYDQTVSYFVSSDPDSVVIHDWMPPTATMVSSQLDEKEQFDMLQKHLVELNLEINQHRDIKSKILIKFPSKCNNYTKVLSNWEARSKYLLHEIIKYQNYCDALEKSIQKRQAFLIEDEVDGDTLSTTSLSPTKLTFQTSSVDLFKEINQELLLNL